MVEVFPLFVCCKHGELTFEVLMKKGCCWHTAGFSQTKKVNDDLKRGVKLWVEHFRQRHKASKEVR